MRSLSHKNFSITKVPRDILNYLEVLQKKQLVWLLMFYFFLCACVLVQWVIQKFISSSSGCTVLFCIIYSKIRVLSGLAFSKFGI